ncbi:MAG: GNAT family N-acetyltransferase, partial [Actinobacteria bacterium]
FLSVFMRSIGAPAELSGDRSKIPAFSFPERAALALEAAVHYGEWLARPEGTIPELDGIDHDAARAGVDAAIDRLGETGGWLEPAEVEALFGAYGIAMPRSVVVTDREAAVQAAAEMGGPVVLKVIAPSALHKSDVGGVALDIRGDDAVAAAFDKVWGAVADPDGVLVQEFVAGGHEVFIGMVEDPNFGPLLVFGLGGVFVELIGDVAFRIHPLTDLDAAEMISEVKSARLLEGYRGGEPGDVAAVQETLLRISAMIGSLPEISEMDLNPVKVRPPGAGVTVVDARVRVRRVAETLLPTRDALVSSV